jgi:hypothetical protein
MRFNLVARAAARKTAAPFTTVLSKVQVEFAETGNFDYISLKLVLQIENYLIFLTCSKLIFKIKIKKI